MGSLIQFLAKLVGKYGINIAVLLYIIHNAWQKYQEYLKQKSEFASWSSHVDMAYLQCCVMSTEHISLGRVEKRTLFTKKLSDVFPNIEMRKKVLEAAEKCSEDQPILSIFLGQDDKWPILNTCTNAISELFAPYHVFFNEARRHPSYYQSSWYCFTLTCQRTSGGGRFFITPYKSVPDAADIGILRIRVMMMNEQELRQVACGEIEAPQTFFNGRHLGRFTVVQRFADLFMKQLETVTGQRQVANWGLNFCGRLSKKNKGFSHEKSSNDSSSMNRGSSSVLGTDEEEQEEETERKEEVVQWEPEDNCFLRIHVPFPCGTKGNTSIPTSETKCQDVVLYE